MKDQGRWAARECQEGQGNGMWPRELSGTNTLTLASETQGGHLTHGIWDKTLALAEAVRLVMVCCPSKYKPGPTLLNF